MLDHDQLSKPTTPETASVEGERKQLLAEVGALANELKDLAGYTPVSETISTQDLPFGLRWSSDHNSNNRRQHKIGYAF